MNPRLVDHLATWLGAWPPQRPLHVTTAPTRSEPGWDGSVHPVVGVASPAGAVLSVPPDRVAAVERVAEDVEGLRAAGGALGDALGIDGGRLYDGVFRWCDNPEPLADAGVWVPVRDPRVPRWLLPFGGEVLMAFDEGDEGDEGDEADGRGARYVAGVGIKVHDPFGQELAVVTEEAAQGRGLARRLVAQAARRVLERGAVATYLHADANVRSAKVADAAGFPDRGWRILGVAPRRPAAPAAAARAR